MALGETTDLGSKPSLALNLLCVHHSFIQLILSKCSESQALGDSAVSQTGRVPHLMGLCSGGRDT